MTVSSAISAATSAASSSSSSSSTSASMGMSSTDFLNLLVSELQNQDPLNATSTTDFINQLTSYANFTEQQSTNASMTSLASSFSSLVTLNSVNYIGHTVEAKTNTAELTNGSATFGYSLTSAASNVAITIQDSSGNTVWSGKGTGNAGSNTFTWNGQTTSGTQLSNGGQYTIQVTATDAAGNSLLSYTSMTGTVTGIDASGSTPSLLVNGVPVSAANIIGVTS
ncbi:flagellar hook capping FlgD N-terminal domain-containing protein [Bradyrhizobium sp. CER78]|uniref:flagellar hook assembly protein FlgD n=1 Tax=Bradyrhizobium sp. CER78 TaxID=3039162 RepID=UPI00244B7A15|nr:flagellar hook capping FlgD N-terminal domain-containing protein [Bradyrhizobium sp. CER78]MDH2382381.1 flagellar hook capping FlgD N-terminal domain-containing protein [Bradyrhizobium sp. CER78]